MTEEGIDCPSLSNRETPKTHNKGLQRREKGSCIANTKKKGISKSSVGQYLSFASHCKVAMCDQEQEDKTREDEKTMQRKGGSLR